MTPLEKELRFFAENRTKWVERYPDKFVLVKGEELINAFDTPEMALSEGARLFGGESFLVKQVTSSDEEIYIPALALGLLPANPA